MKNLILTTLLSSFLISSSAFAEKIVADLRSVDLAIASVQLTDTGTLKVQIRDGALETIQLTKANADEMLYRAQIVGDAELVTDVHPVRCMIAIHPFSIQTLQIVDSKTGELKTVLSHSSCAMGTFTHPKEEYQMTAAQQLKSELMVLARQLE